MLFEIMLGIAAAIAIAGVVIAFDGSRDVFHPLIFIGPMMLFLYGYMPFQLLQHNSLERFFDTDQLLRVQTLNILGITAFVLGCLVAGVRLRPGQIQPMPLTASTKRRLLFGAAIIGFIGVACWAMMIKNVGGFTAAFSSSYAGGYDDSGYVRDGSMWLLVALMLCVTSLSAGGPRLLGTALAVTFAAPWLCSALLMGRRGPTFNIAIVVAMGWYFSRKKRPPILLTAVGGMLLGWFVLFLVTNRSQLYIGSSFDFKTDVSENVQKADTGNEFIYGSGTVLSAERRDHYFWMRRYLAEILVRPIPSSVWPTKYEDFGVPELLFNAGTGEGFGDTLGWVGAVGSAPGIIADFFVEVSWGAILLMGIVGYGYGFFWRRAVMRGGPWVSQYIIFSALSIYLIMQTGEAVIFRTLEWSAPSWIAWQYALKAPVRRRKPSRFFAPSELGAPVLVQTATFAHFKGTEIQKGPLPYA